MHLILRVADGAAEPPDWIGPALLEDSADAACLADLVYVTELPSRTWATHFAAVGIGTTLVRAEIDATKGAAAGLSGRAAFPGRFAEGPRRFTTELFAVTDAKAAGVIAAF